MIETDPDWDTILAIMPPGTKVIGVVDKKFPFGIVLDIQFPLDLKFPFGLLELMKISDDPSVSDSIMEDINLGDTISAIVVSVDINSGIRLSSRKSDFAAYGYEDGW